MSYIVHYEDQGQPSTLSKDFGTEKEAQAAIKFWKNYSKIHNLDCKNFYIAYNSEQNKQENQMQSKNIENFVKAYFEAESRAAFAGPWSTHKQFLVQDQCQLIENLRTIVKSGEIDRIYSMAVILADCEGTYSTKQARRSAITRHSYRLKRWDEHYQQGVLKIENAIAVKREAKVQMEDCAKLKKNLIDSAKSISHSALKNNLSEEEIQIIFNSGLITAKEERKVQETKGALQAFLRQNGITKDIAMQILESA